MLFLIAIVNPGHCVLLTRY